MRKTILQAHQSSFVQKAGRKSTKYWRNELSLKIGHISKAIAHVKAIGFAKWSVWLTN